MIKNIFKLLTSRTLVNKARRRVSAIQHNVSKFGETLYISTHPHILGKRVNSPKHNGCGCDPRLRGWIILIFGL